MNEGCELVGFVYFWTVYRDGDGRGDTRVSFTRLRLDRKRYFRGTKPPFSSLKMYRTRRETEPTDRQAGRESLTYSVCPDAESFKLEIVSSTPGAAFRGGPEW